MLELVMVKSCMTAALTAWHTLKRYPWALPVLLLLGVLLQLLLASTLLLLVLLRLQRGRVARPQQVAGLLGEVVQTWCLVQVAAVLHQGLRRLEARCQAGHT
jgi:hypothetical protein